MATSTTAHSRRVGRTAAIAVSVLALVATSTEAGAGAASGSPTTDADAASLPASDLAKVKRNVVAKDINVPWGLAFLPGGSILVGSRDRARITLVRKNGAKKLARRMTGVVPNGTSGGEAGLLGLALAPGFGTNHWVYAYISSARDNRIVRMKWDGRRLGRQHLVFKGIPRALHHNGGGLGFGPDGMLYATTGEAEVPMRAQRKRNLGGKILRMTPTGRPAPGNPMRNSVVYSWGHRNVEGLDWDSKGRLWATEFGDHKVDELNLIRKGHNYGWPIVEGRSDLKRFTNPKMTWPTDAAGPAGIGIRTFRGKTYAYIGGLTGHRLWRVRLEGKKATAKKPLFTNQYGRIRSAKIARGDLWITSSNTDGRATPGAHDDKLIRVRLPG